jgi:tripartite-type tricarboxylate transporter receptor subunit TctC
MRKSVSLPRIVLTIALSLLVSPAVAQDGYPVKAVKILVGFSPGGNHDIFARISAKKLTDTWGQPVIVDNRPGANGMIATESLAKATPDGYTLHVFTVNDAVNVSMYPKMAYDTLTDLAPVTPMSASPYLLGVHPSLPVQTVQELIALAKARPGQLSYSSSGVGSGIHLSSELFKRMAGIDMVHVPYKGAGPALIDLVGGQIHLSMASMAACLPHVRTGRIRAIAVTGVARSRVLQTLPTVAESGVPGYEAGTWNGIVVPARTPDTIVAKLNRDIVRTLDSLEVKELFRREGGEASGGAPRDLARYIAAEIVKWAAVVKAIDARAD